MAVSFVAVAMAAVQRLTCEITFEIAASSRKLRIALN
jgi:hypothetical protein